MTVFDSLFAEVRRGEREREFVVHRRGEETDVEAQFAAHNVDVTERTLPPGGPPPFLVIRESGDFAGAIALADLEGLLAPPIVRPGERDEVSPGYRVLFEVLDDTIFSSLKRRELLAVAREIENRAFRVGRGTLRVSFQALSAFRSQVDVYELLARETSLDIHVYGDPDWTPPEIRGVTYHGDGDPALNRYWTLAFDGGGDDAQTCALVARERADDYRGFWTNDPARVSTILATLEDASDPSG